MGDRSLSNYLILIVFIFTIGCKNESDTTTLPATPISASSTYLRHWNLSNSVLPLHLSIDNSFSTEEQDAISEVKEEWNITELDQNLIDNDFTVTPPINTGSLSSYRDNILGIYKVTKWFPEVGSSALAVTQFFAYPRVDAQGVTYYEIVHADVMVNYQDHQFSLNPDYYSEEYDLKSVVVHELGHLLGLGHVNDWSIASVMLPSISIAETRRELYARDIDDILKLYGPNSSSSITNIAHPLNTSSTLIRGIIELKTDGHCSTYLLKQ